VTVLPMFPLGTVLVPHQPLPLHVFESRYRALVHDCLASDRTFGVVLIERGHEVGGGDVRFDVGCTAEIVEAEETPDGRWGLGTIGRRPLRVRAWLDDAPYPRAEVDVLDDGAWDDAAESAFAAALGAFEHVIGLAEQGGMSVDRRVLDLPGEAMWDHWLLVARAPIGDLDRLGVLAADGPAARLTALAGHLDDVAAVLASRLGGG
jgi:Lon protease-like protein